MKSVVRLLSLLPLVITLACRPSTSDDQEQAFESLVRAERAFANTSVASGARSAFLEFFAADGVVFDAGPVNVRTVWEPRPASEAVLSWGPEIADVSAAGDLGFTSGPYEVRPAPGAAPVGWGHFISVWSTDSTGTWRVAADGGVTHGPATLNTDSVVVRIGGSGDMSSSVEDVDQAAATAGLLERDTQYSRSVTENGFPDSMDGFVNRSARFYRNGHLPLVGRDVVTTTAAVTDAVWTAWEIGNAIVSNSADLGCTYGVVEFQPDAGASGASWTASYYRIWKRAPGATWLVVVDVLIPYVPSA